MTSSKRASQFGLSLALLASFIVAGCSGSGESSSTTSSTTTPANTTPTATTTEAKRPVPTATPVALSGDTIKIGMVASLSGDQRAWGEDSRDGAQMAVDEFNAAGGLAGKKVSMDVGDSASKPEAAKTAAEKLLSDGVIGIVGEVASGHTIQIAKSAFEKNVPVVAIGATKTTLTDNGANIFRVCYTDDFQGPVIAAFAYDKLHIKTVAIMTDNKQPYSQGLSASFKDTFVSLGGQIVAEETYETGQNQFSGQITEIASKNPGGVFMSGYFPEVGPLAQQLRQAGVKAVFMGGDGWDSPQLLESGSDAIIGSYFCNHYNNKDNRPQVTEFLKKYVEKFKKRPGTTMAALGYDAMSVTLDALKRAKTPITSLTLTEAIADIEGFKGVSGDITLKGHDGNPPKRAIVVQVGKKDEQGDWQKFAIDYVPDQVAKIIADAKAKATK